MFTNPHALGFYAEARLGDATRVRPEAREVRSRPIMSHMPVLRRLGIAWRRRGTLLTRCP